MKTHHPSSPSHTETYKSFLSTEVEEGAVDPEEDGEVDEERKKSKKEKKEKKKKKESKKRKHKDKVLERPPLTTLSPHFLLSHFASTPPPSVVATVALQLVCFLLTSRPESMTFPPQTYVHHIVPFQARLGF